MAIRNQINGIMKYSGTILARYFDEQVFEANEELNPYRIVRKQLYALLELQEVVDLDFRLDNLVKAQKLIGTNKSKLNKLTRMDVIEQHPELHEPALRIAEQLKRRYEAQCFAINIDLSDISDFEMVDIYE